VRCEDTLAAPLGGVVDRYGIRLTWVPAGATIPGSFWGECEAGLIGNQLLVRADTPLHSALHETCHFVCMDAGRRTLLHTNAGGDHEEECAVCYLQVLMADHFDGFGRQRMFADMDAWGYSFRLGAARDWFERDAADARAWLVRHHLIDNHDQVTWQKRV
jgi:hypothetical protein